MKKEAFSMKKLYVFLFSIFLVFTASAAWADSIDQVVISEGPSVIVEITGTFACDVEARAPFTLQTSVENKIMIQIFTNPPSPDCTGQDVQFTLQEKIIPPEHGGYKVIVLLYSGVPCSKDDKVVLLDSEKIIVKEEVTAMVDINPNTINLKRRGQFISAKIRMPEGYDLANIVPDSIKLYMMKDNDELTEGIPAQRVMADMFDDVLNVKFSNLAVLNLIKENITAFPATVKFLVQWQIQGGEVYEGTDEVRVINPGKGKDKDKGQGKGKDKGKDNDED
jgi:hypothetical protein